MDQNFDELALNEHKVIALADMVAKVPMRQTARKLGVHERTIQRYQKQFRKFMMKNQDHRELVARIFGLAPLVIENLIELLVHKDKEATLAFARGWGFLPKDTTELKELFAAMAAMAVAGNSNNVTVNIGDMGNGDSADIGDMRNIFARDLPRSRFDPNDN